MPEPKSLVRENFMQGSVRGISPLQSIGLISTRRYKRVAKGAALFQQSRFASEPPRSFCKKLVKNF